MRTLLSCLVLACLFLGGCQPSLWEEHFVGARPNLVPAHKPLLPPADVVVRQVSWDRIQQTLRELEAEAANSDVPVDEWLPDQRARADAKLLKGLQVTGDPATVSILGVSEFRTTDFSRPATGELQKLAARLGANTVVWAAMYTGKADTIVQQPVTTYSTWTNWYARGRGAQMVTTSSTTWVPMMVQADEHVFTAFFLARK